jgi:Cu(I)/Ag(I) efflux system membrane fusion protein
MAIARWAILVVSALLAAGTWWIYAVREPAAVQGPARFYCPMHPQITAPVPGSCPICWMRLEPISEERHLATTPSDARGAEDPRREDLAPVMLTTERRQLAGIASVPARRRAAGGSLRLPARVEAREGSIFEVRVRVPAFVERALVGETGVRVRAGQSLAEVYAPEIVQAQEELLVASRWSSASGERAVPGAAEVAARARERLLLLGVAAHDIDAILEAGRVRRTVPVRAPASGWVTQRSAVVGAYAQPDQPLYVVADLSRVWIVASAFADQVGSVEPRTRGRFVPRDGGEPVEITLDRVVPVLESAARTASIRFVAPNSRLRLLPGAIGEVEIDLPRREHLLVPRDAVIDTGTARYVFVEREGGLFEPRPVEIGALFGEERAILDGLQEGERVVARGAFVLDSESRLQAALAPRAPADASGPAAAPPAVPAGAHDGRGPARGAPAGAR